MALDRFDAAVIARHFPSGATGAVTEPASDPPATASRRTRRRRRTEDRSELADDRPEDVPVSGESIEGDDHSRVVRRLLDAVPAEWDRVANAIVQYRDARGGDGPAARCRVAVVGAGRRVGCSTAAEGIAATLAARGVDVVVKPIDRSAPHMVNTAVDEQTETGRVEILDASDWFGPGPVRRPLAARLRESSDAAILVRKASGGTLLAHARSLEAVGMNVLGEVIEFVPRGGGQADVGRSHSRDEGTTEEGAAA